AVRSALVARLEDALGGGSGIVEFIRTGAASHPRFKLLAADLTRLLGGDTAENDAFRASRLLLEALRHHFFTGKNEPRKRPFYKKEFFAGDMAWRRHQELLEQRAPAIAEAADPFGPCLDALHAPRVA